MHNYYEPSEAFDEHWRSMTNDPNQRPHLGDRILFDNGFRILWFAGIVIERWWEKDGEVLTVRNTEVWGSGKIPADVEQFKSMIPQRILKMIK